MGVHLSCQVTFQTKSEDGPESVAGELNKWEQLRKLKCFSVPCMCVCEQKTLENTDHFVTGGQHTQSHWCWPSAGVGWHSTSDASWVHPSMSPINEFIEVLCLDRLLKLLENLWNQGSSGQTNYWSLSLTLIIAATMRDKNRLLPV